MLAAGLRGWLLRKATWLERVVLAIGGLLMIVPGLTTDLIGLAAGAAVLVSQWVALRYPRKACEAQVNATNSRER